jgi:hypothetical protein
MIEIPSTSGLTEADQEILRFIVTVCGSLSIAGSLFIIVSYLKFKEFKLFHLRLILYLTVSDLGASITVRLKLTLFD